MTYPARLNEPVITALVRLLENGLAAQVEAINTELTDPFLLDPPVAILDYMPFSVTLEQGMPVIGVQDLSSTFENDLVHSMEATHSVGVVTVIQTSDHQTLAWQLRRYNQAIARTIQADRMLGPAGILASEALVMYTRFAGVEPGPLLGDRDPDSPGEPPSSYRSWTWFLLDCRRQELGG